MEKYLFFNSGVGDPRTYEASHFADYFGSVLSTGLLHTDNIPGMSVSVETGTLNTIVSLGKAIMKGRLYENTSDLTLTHNIPEVDLDRIDRVILRLNLSNSERNIKLMVLSGTPSATPIEPVLVRDNFIHDISLAQILVRANTVQLLQTDLVDERLDETLAGLVYSLISIPTSQFQDEWDAFMAGIVDSGFATIGSVDAVSGELTTHKADDALIKHNAKQIGLEDIDNLFTAVNLESGMKELFTNVSSGKDLVGGAITGVDPSVVIPTDPTFQNLADAVGGISTAAIESVQHGIVSVPVNGQPPVQVISAIDLSRSVIIMHGVKSSASNIGEQALSAKFGINTEVVINRQVSGYAMTASYTVIEFAPGVNIQSGYTTPSIATTSFDITISSVDISKSILLFSYFTGAESFSLGSLMGYLLNPTTLRFERTGTTSRSFGITYFVVEFN